MSTCSNIRRIVRLRQLVLRWRKKSAVSASYAPPGVPPGHIVVAVGFSRRRFVVRATYLNHPLFAKLLDMAEEEYGFQNSGPLTLPCDEDSFGELIRFLDQTESSGIKEFQRICRLGIRSEIQISTDSLPLLH